MDHNRRTVSLNEEQERAADHTEGPLMVLAGPGSGKTTLIVERLVRMIERAGIPEGHIMTVTYTRAAAQEMQSRFLYRRGTDKTSACFGTFHSIFWGILRSEDPVRYGGNGPDSLRIMDGEEEESLKERIRESLVEEWLQEFRHGGFHTAAAAFPGFSGQPEEFEERLARQAEERYQEEKKRLRRIDFHDILTLALALVRKETVLRRLRERYRYFLIDEFQDTDALQYEVMKKLAGPRANLFVVGDDDQAIYGFRGAGSAMLSRFASDHPQAPRVVLPVNYRSTEHIIRFGQRFMDRRPDRFVKNMHGVRGEGRPVEIRTFLREEREARAVALLASRLERKKDLAVLVRSRHDADTIMASLTDYGIPFVCPEGASHPFRHFIGRDIELFLQAARGSKRAFLAILHKPDRGIYEGVFSQGSDADDVRTIPLDGVSPEMRIRIRQLFYDLSRFLRKRPADALRMMAGRLGYLEHLDLLAKASATPYAVLLKRWRFFVRWSGSFDSWEAWENAFHRAQENPDDTDGAVRIMTVHGAKGLEFPIVWIPELSEGVFPHRRADDAAEEARLFYVGCTRAMNLLILSRPLARGGRRAGASPFFEESLRQHEEDPEGINIS